jgi:MFS family permease
MAILYAANKRPYMTFLTIFLLTMPNATARTIGFLTLVGQICGFLFEVPSGYVSDKIGHKNALVIARFSIFLSTACYVFADNIYWFFAGAILLALGFAFTSGTSSAFMHETLDSLGKKDKYAEITGKVSSAGFAVPIVLIIVLPIIAENNFRLAFLVMMVIDFIALATAVALTNPKSKQEVEEVDLETFPQTLRKFFKSAWLKYVVLAAIAFGITFGATAGFKNPYQEILGFSLTALGLLWAASRGIISMLLLVNGKIKKILSFEQLIITQMIIYTVAFIGIGLSSNMWVVAILFMITTATMWGLGAVRSQYDLEFIGNSKSKATLISIKAFIQNILTGLVGLGMGLLVFNLSYGKAYLIVGFSMFVLAGVSSWILNKK